MKIFICLTLLLSVAMYALATGDDEFDAMKMIKINVQILQGRCLDILEDMNESKVLDPQFYLLLGHVTAYEDCLKIINVVQARQCNKDLKDGK
jgi:hypothetical protein